MLLRSKKCSVSIVKNHPKKKSYKMKIRTNYPLIWTSILDEPWFLSMTGNQRLIFLMLILGAKKQGDVGTVNFRSWRAAAEFFGVESRTARASVEHCQSIGKAKVAENSTGVITIEVVNYLKYQNKSAFDVCNITQVSLKGKERKGKEQNRKERSSISAPEGDGPTPGSRLFSVYAEAYKMRYGANPVRNMKVNLACKRFVERLGENAGEVIKFYLLHNNAWYVRQGHSVECAERDAEKLHTEWLTGRKVHTTTAMQMDRSDSNTNAIQRVVEKLRAQGEEGL